MKEAMKGIHTKVDNLNRIANFNCKHMEGTPIVHSSATIWKCKHPLKPDNPHCENCEYNQ